MSETADELDLHVVAFEKLKDLNLILGQSHFIKTLRVEADVADAEQLLPEIGHRL